MLDSDYCGGEDIVEHCGVTVAGTGEEGTHTVRERGEQRE